MKTLMTVFALCLCGAFTTLAQDFHLPVSTTSKKARKAYAAASYLGSNIRFEAAQLEIDKALKADPDFFMAYVYAAQVLARGEKKAELIRKALAIDPSGFTRAEMIMRSQLSIWNEDPEAKPTETMDALVAAYPETPEAREWAYLHAAYTENDLDRAFRHASRMVELAPDFGPVYNALGYFHMEREEMDKARAAFEKYLELAPAEPNAYDSMGEYLLNTGDYYKSAEYYDRAVALGMEDSQKGADKARKLLRGETATERVTATDGPVQQNLERYAGVWDRIVNHGELDKINDQYFDPAVVMVSDPAPITGIDAFRDYYRNFLTGFSDISFSIIDAFGQDDRIVKHWRFRGTHSGVFFGIPATGKAVDIEGVTLAEMKNGRITREQDFLDNMAFMQQLGLLSDPGNLAVVNGVYESFSRGDIPAVLGALDAAVVWNEAEGNALADGNPYIGPDAVLQGVFARLGAEHEYFRLKDIQLHEISGNRVLATLRYDARRKANGAQIDAQAAHLWSLQDGKITGFQQYTDTRQLAEAAARE